MRLFVAITPPRAVLLEVQTAVDALKRGNAPEVNALLRWTRPETWHITVAFYGEVPEDKAEDLAARLAPAGARAHPGRLLRRGAGGQGRGPGRAAGPGGGAHHAQPLGQVLGLVLG